MAKSKLNLQFTVRELSVLSWPQRRMLNRIVESNDDPTRPFAVVDGREQRTVEALERRGLVRSTCRGGLWWPTERALELLRELEKRQKLGAIVFEALREEYAFGPGWYEAACVVPDDEARSPLIPEGAPWYAVVGGLCEGYRARALDAGFRAEGLSWHCTQGVVDIMLWGDPCPLSPRPGAEHLPIARVGVVHVGGKHSRTFVVRGSWLWEA